MAKRVNFLSKALGFLGYEKLKETYENATTDNMLDKFQDMLGIDQELMDDFKREFITPTRKKPTNYKRLAELITSKLKFNMSYGELSNKIGIHLLQLRKELHNLMLTNWIDEETYDTIVENFAIATNGEGGVSSEKMTLLGDTLLGIQEILEGNDESQE